MPQLDASGELKSKKSFPNISQLLAKRTLSPSLSPRDKSVQFQDEESKSTPFFRAGMKPQIRDSAVVSVGSGTGPCFIQQ
jgi:hypothetical protein